MEQQQQAPQTPQTFEAALQRLEFIVAQLENGQSTLEDSMKLFEEGMKLHSFCNTKLSEAEKKLEKLVKKDDGTLAWQEQ